MGTRADYYVGTGTEAIWLGSTAWDGYPDGLPQNILTAEDEQDFRDAVVDFLNNRDDATVPENGWPWPWDDSNTTDYAYAFDLEKGHVVATCFGREFFRPDPNADNFGERTDDAYYEGDKGHPWPYKGGAKDGLTLGERSGLIVVGIPIDPDPED